MRINFLSFAGGFALAGIIIALICAAVLWGCHYWLPASIRLERIAFLFWPSAVILMFDSDNILATVVAFLFSILLNGLIYFIVGATSWFGLSKCKPFLAIPVAAIA